MPLIKTRLIRMFENNTEVISFIESIEIDMESIVNSILIFLRSGAISILASSISVLNTFINFIVAIIFAFYILSQKEILKHQILKVMYVFLKKKYVEYIVYTGQLTYKIFYKFIYGQCIDAVILGIMFFISMVIFRLPYALLIGVLISFTALIPIAGAFIGCGIGAILILMQSPVKAAIFVALFLILQQIEGNIIYPKIVGNSVGLPSIWVLFSVIIGGGLMGVLGMLISVPLVSVIYNLFKEYVNYKLKNKPIKCKL